MSPETEAWGRFCAAVFVWMGGSLFLGAPEHARSASVWMAGEGKGDLSQCRRLAFFYRLGGVFFAGFGLWVLRAAPFSGPELGRGGRIAAGFFFLVCGCLLAAAKAAAARRPAPESVRERAHRLWGWGSSLVFLAFGAYLLRFAGGHHV
jgi:hypothetical protein